MPKIIAKKEDWIILGYKLFSKKGISGIVVEKMALKLSVNKSSFYWHFKTKKDFKKTYNFIISSCMHWSKTKKKKKNHNKNNNYNNHNNGYYKINF